MLFEKLKKIWLRTPAPVRKIFVFAIGWIVVIAGIAMLVLPGPGWAAIFIGFAILATEFASAHRVHRWLVSKLEAVIAWGKKLWSEISKQKR
jgi:uncharacterized protein (TIGR02611 family)